MNTNFNIKNDVILPYDVNFAQKEVILGENRPIDVILGQNDVISQNNVIFKIWNLL